MTMKTSDLHIAEGGGTGAGSTLRALFNLDWLCRIESDLMVEFARELREVRDQLAAVCGEQRPKSIGRCIELIDTPEGQQYCDTWLYGPKTRTGTADFRERASLDLETGVRPGKRRTR